jgi:hypothetical protein
MKQPRKVALVDVSQYPRERYSAYFEIQVMGDDGEGYEWSARIYDRATSKVMDESLGEAVSRDAADTAAQQWVIEHMKNYRRADHALKMVIALNPFVFFDALLRLFDDWLRPLLAIAYSTVVRNERVQRVQVNIDLGAGAGLLRIYDGSRPATGGAATTLLAELTFSDPCAGAAAAGVLTMSAITADAAANATGTASWFRCVDSTATFVMDGNVGTSGSDLNLNAVGITVGQQVSVTSMTITGGNP